MKITDIVSSKAKHIISKIIFGYVFVLVLLMTLIILLFYNTKPEPEYKFKIDGVVNTTDGPKMGTAFTDTIYGSNEDSIWYCNTNGSKIVLYKPYFISNYFNTYQSK